ncbi:uncharacterized protein LOC114456957 [Gouania willdenowi]|uniref:uncharacterized protein LOC114456957 n=1 Tax=Gouania willdenowi TaxID=441366 RepID=UPI00105629FD|nr:uncharacterized protein LOC114456957 [Gouania willdenowi]
MEILKEDDPELEDPVEQLPPHTAERTCVDALLSLSEESSMNNLGPFEYKSYSGWEEAVCGWTKASPLSCILGTETNHRNSKQRENDKLASSSTHLTLSKAENSVDQHKTKNPTSAGKRSASQSHTSPYNHHSDTAEGTVSNTMKLSMGNLLIKDKMEEERPRENPAFPLKCNVSENDHIKLLKYSHRLYDNTIPLKNVTFLPPIWSPILNSKMSPCKGKKASQARTLVENCVISDKSSSRTISVNTITKSDSTPYLWKHVSENQTFQPNSQVFPTDKKYGIQIFPELQTSHKPSCPMGNRTTHAIIKKAHGPILMKNQAV